jgi:hypothetical protein
MHIVDLKNAAQGHKVRNLMAAMQLALIDKLGFCGLITRTVVSMLVNAGKAVESWAEGAGGVDWAVRISGTKYSGDKIWKVNAQSVGCPAFHTSSFSKEVGLVHGRVVFPDSMKMLADKYVWVRQANTRNLVKT